MIRQLFVRNVTNLDFAWLDAKKGLLGESLNVAVALEGEMDERGFIMDFGPCKKWIKNLVDQHLDHTCVVPMQSPALKVLGKDELRMSFEFHSDQGNFTYEAPRHTLVLLDEDELTLSSFAKYLEEVAQSQLPERVTSVKFTLTEDPQFKSSANYRYTHGLKLHEGNCQRLFHGHRNPLEIYTNGLRQERMEVFLCDYFKQVHFVPLSSIVSSTETLKLAVRDLQSQENLKISYQAPQGEFTAEIPVKDCFILDEEPSIERITEVAWAIVKKEFGIADSTSLVVSCFEGLTKGCSYGNS